MMHTADSIPHMNVENQSRLYPPTRSNHFDHEGYFQVGFNCAIPTRVDELQRPQYSDPVDKEHFASLDKFGQWREEDLKTFGKLSSATPKSNLKPWKF